MLKNNFRGDITLKVSVKGYDPTSLPLAFDAYVDNRRIGMVVPFGCPETMTSLVFVITDRRS